MKKRASTLLVFVAIASLGCPAGRKPRPAPQIVVTPPPAVAPKPAPPPPPPGEREMNEANAALRSGDRVLAAAKLDAILAMGARAPSRGEALFTLGVIESLPDNPARDVARARSLLEEAITSGASPSRAQASRLIVSLLAQEEEQTRAILDLRAQIDASKTEVEELRAALAQREAELRKIKEILLEKVPGS